MHWVVCAVLQQAFDLPILTFQKTIEDNLEKEIDFQHELENGEKARVINKRNDIYIPISYKEYSTKRVLVSEWIDGIKVTHLNDIKKMGFDQKSVMKTVIECFAE
jgi:predicted unusual protein kinase regulating ubiquinone biosynthesis (AarF/ABC1/UbiB family)